MAIKRRQVWMIECALCGGEHLDPGNGELLGLTVRGSWAGTSGGCPVPKTWICQDCTVNSVSLSALISDAMMGD